MRQTIEGAPPQGRWVASSRSASKEVEDLQYRTKQRWCVGYQMLPEGYQEMEQEPKLKTL